MTIELEWYAVSAVTGQVREVARVPTGGVHFVTTATWQGIPAER